jgi:hypothetical protein
LTKSISAWLLGTGVVKMWGVGEEKCDDRDVRGWGMVGEGGEGGGRGGKSLIVPKIDRDHHISSHRTIGSVFQPRGTLSIAC